MTGKQNGRQFAVPRKEERSLSVQRGVSLFREDCTLSTLVFSHVGLWVYF